MSFQFELVAPERAMASTTATAVTVPGVEGDFTVMTGHAPFVAALRPGVLTAVVEGGETNRYVVYGGVAEVGPGHLTVLAEEVHPVEELEPATLSDRIKDAEEELKTAGHDEVHRRAQHLNDLRAMETLRS